MKQQLVAHKKLLQKKVKSQRKSYGVRTKKAIVNPIKEFADPQRMIPLTFSAQKQVEPFLCEKKHDNSDNSTATSLFLE